MTTINLSEQDVTRPKVIVMDEGRNDAYAFLHDCIMPGILKQESTGMKSHLDGGKGSMF